MGQFQGQVVVVTGASSGIGAEMARQFAQQGADVVLTARRVERLEALAEEIRSMGRRALPIACDVTVDGDIEQVVAKTHEELGDIHVVVANAGFGVAGVLEDLTLDDYRRQLETNVFGVLRTVYATLDDLKKTKGRLAIVSSVSGYASLPTSSAYSMSKFAVRALCESITPELHAHGVSVTMLSPGFVASEIRKVDNAGVYKEARKDIAPAWMTMDTDVAVRKMLRAIAKRKRERIITFHGWLTVQLTRWVPGLILWLFKKTYKKPKKNRKA
ncbi:MAG: SDR family oxidoreductase [Deltaproteobacteria bacterium]|nr:MAG: SDR family oxidoreductase [Deltaproteobacteria bacterium]